MGAFIELDTSGDTKTVWDSNNEDEVAAVREQFERLKNNGYIAYRVDDDGKKSEVMHDFDPQAGRIIMAPGIQGG